MTIMAVVLSVAGSVPAAADDQRQPEAAGPGYWITFGHSGRCLTVPGNSTAPSTQLDQYDCMVPVQNNQLWEFEFTSNGFARLRNRHSGLCANVSGGSGANGAAIIQWPCGNFPNELWKGTYAFTYQGLDYYQLKAQHTGKCMAVRNADPANSAQLVQWDCSPPLDGTPNDVETWFAVA
jgi:hypothetical protein